MSADRPPVDYQTRDGVGFVTLDRPDALNALDLATIESLQAIANDATTNSEVRALLLTGRGRAFSAGGDIKAMAGMTGQVDPRGAMLDGVGALHRALSDLHRLPKPLIAAVNGPAAGAGVGLALLADIVWAGSSASFTLAFTAIGVSPDSGTTHSLVRAVGPKLAAELFLTNRSVPAEEARRIGLVSQVLPDDELLPAAQELAITLARGATAAFGRVKNLVRESLGNGFETQLAREREEVGRSATTQDFSEGLRAFVEKRQPSFRGS